MFSRKLKIIASCLVVSLFICVPFWSEEEDSDWFWGKTISQVSFEGLVTVKKSELSGVTSSFIGKEFNDTVYNDILDRLYSLDYFDEIEPFAKHDPKSADKILLFFNVKERLSIESIEFKGNRKIRNNELKESVSAKAGDIFVDSAVLLDERAIRDLYIKKGYSNVKVTHSSHETENGVKVVFDISEGKGTVITSIKFNGNSVFSERTLKSKLSLKEEGFMKDGAFQWSSLESDKQAVLNYYNTRGYADARVVDVLQESVQNEEKEREELSLTFLIQEGAQYTFSGLSVSGNEIFSSEKLLAFMKLKNGDIYNQTKLREGISSITNLYYENGYMTNEFIPSVNKDSELHTIGYSLTIVERSRAHIENIIVKGNTKTKDEVIIREIPLKPGDVFSRDKVMAGLRNLYNLQYFSNIVPEPVAGSEENLVNLVISVEETSTTMLQLGMTFSGVSNAEDLPISLFFKWQNSNLSGKGRVLSAGVTAAKGEQSVDFSFGQNWIFGEPIQISESLSFFHEKSSSLVMNMLPNGLSNEETYYMAYDSIGTSLTSAVGRRWSPMVGVLTLSGGLTNTLQRNDYDQSLYSPLDSGVNKYANRLGLKNSIFASFSVDARDLSYDPSKGWFASQRLTWYGLIPRFEQEFYLRSDTKLEGYFTLFNVPLFNDFWNFKGVLAFYTGFTMQFPLVGTTIPRSSMTYIDGMFNARGWQDVSSFSRGRAMLSNRVEFRIPIFPGVIGIAGFFDFAAVKETPEKIFTDLSFNDFYFSFGPALRFLIPQFPLHLLFSNKFRVIDGNVVWNKTWDFSLSFNMVNR